MPPEVPCRLCKNLVDYDARTCPHCGESYPYEWALPVRRLCIVLFFMMSIVPVIRTGVEALGLEGYGGLLASLLVGGVISLRISRSEWLKTLLARWERGEDDAD